MSDVPRSVIALRFENVLAWAGSPVDSPHGTPNSVIDRWRAFLGDCEDALEGRKLIPFWRSKDGRGINLKRVFTEPRMFDLVLWMQGSAAGPYLEKGEPASAANISELNCLLGGEAFMFSIWSN